jgi:hypothetical protein
MTWFLSINVGSYAFDRLLAVGVAAPGTPSALICRRTNVTRQNILVLSTGILDNASGTPEAAAAMSTAAPVDVLSLASEH